jgi:iron complex transport system ATP-binding protein
MEHVVFRYGAHVVLDDVSLEIPRGKLSVLLGRNGSGKSTLLRVMAGIADCGKGRVEYFGEDGRRMTTRGRAGVVGYLPQQHRTVFPFSVEDVVLTGRASSVMLLPREADRRVAREAMERVGMLNLARRPYTELSGGEQQLVMIARVLAQEPRIILLDEPTSHLDFINQARLLHLLRSLVASDLTVVAVLHDPNLAFLYGDHFIFLKDGRTQTAGEGRNPWDLDFLESLYGIQLVSIPFRERAFVFPVMR